MARRADADAATSLEQGLEAPLDAAAQRKRVAELEAELRKERRAQVPRQLRLRARGFAAELEEALVDRRVACGRTAQPRLARPQRGRVDDLHREIMLELAVE